MTVNEKKEDWVSFLKHKHKNVFSELDALLRSLDRFFSIENLPISREDLTTRNFYDELNAVRDVIFRILGLIEMVIPESKKNAYWFRKFAESKFLTDYSRDLFKEELYKQDTPEKGLYLLYDSFVNLKGIVNDLLRFDKISYLGYRNIGELISKEIRENMHFSPFRNDIDPDLDRIENPRVSEAVQSVRDREMRRFVSLLYMYLFRCLRYLSHIDTDSRHPTALNSSFLILIMLKPELTMFQKYIKNAGRMVNDEELKFLLQPVSYQFSIELKRVYIHELKEILGKKAYQLLRGKIENSRGILKNLIEQSIVQITQFLRQEVQSNDIFESFTERLYESIKLREDMFILHKFLILLEDKIGLPEEHNAVFESMKNFMRYFENFTFKLLRYDDYDEFSNFFKDIFSLKKSGSNKIFEKIHNFKIFLEATQQHVANRAELRDRPLDIYRAEDFFRQYL